MSTYSSKGMPAPTVYRTNLRGPQAHPRGQGARHLRDGCRTHADRHHRSPVGLRCGVAGPDSRQGARAERASRTSGSSARAHIMPNHLTGRALARASSSDPAERALLEGRAMIVRRLQALPIEAVVRGYLIGSGWKDYQTTGPCAASRCRRACRRRSSCRSRSSRRPPRRKSASTMRTSPSRQTARLIGAPLARTRARHGARAVCVRRRARPRARHHHRRHQVRVRRGRGRHAHAHRRSADAGLLALLAGGHL